MFPVAILLAAAFPCTGTTDQQCPLVGDVDGDGKPDRVWVDRTSRCTVNLVARTASGTLRARLPESPCPTPYWAAEFPRVVALRPMNVRRGFEAEVLMWSGASNDGVRFFTVFRGQLQPMRIRPEPFPRDEWNVGGFAAAFALTDCAAARTVRRAARWWYRRRWHGMTETYRVTATAFVRVASERRFRGVAGDEFRHCGGVDRGPATDP